MTTTATIDQLRPGSEYPGGSINSRKDYTPQQIKDRLESIMTFGVLQSLCVCPAPGASVPPFYVAAGGLRLAAIELGIKTKKLKPDFAIPIIVRPEWDAAMALAASLEENEQVLAPHPAKVFEQFAELIVRGKTADDLATMFHMETKEVARVLKLGELSPVIRKAWVDEEIDADGAKAFTRAKDKKHQEDVFRRLKKERSLYAARIREALGGNERDAEKFLKLVGRKEYEAAGGQVQVDLFARGDDEKLLVLDFPLLVRLVGEKIEAKCKALTEAGWAWAVDRHDLTNMHSMNYIPNPSANAPKELKAKSGCAVEVDYQGKLDVTYGLLKPGVRVGKVGSSKAGKQETARPSTALSNSLKDSLRAYSDYATKDALVADTYGDEVATTLAKIVASQIDVDRGYHTPSVIRDKLHAIRDGLTPAVMNDALQKRFDAKSYFSRAPKLIVLRAIAESVSADESRKLKDKMKSAAWKFALANVPKTWLPPEMRTKHYVAPKAGKVVALADAKKAKAAKPKKKAA